MNRILIAPHDMFFFVMLSIVLSIVLTDVNATPPHKGDLTPPVAAVEEIADTTHGDIRIDPYAWLRDKTDPNVIDYLNAENNYADAVMSHTADFQESLYTEMISRIKETDLSVPYRLDDYYYYSRTEQGQQYRIYCRKHKSLDAEEEIILDQNELAEGHPYCSINTLRVSPDHSLLAYTVDFEGGEVYTIFVKDLTSGEHLTDTLEKVDGPIVWANDNKTIFYSTQDETKRPDKLYRHHLGTPRSEDELIYHETDPMFFLYVTKTRSKQFVLLILGSKTTSEIHVLNADSPNEEFLLFHPRQHEIEYYIDHHKDSFYIMTNEDAKNFKLMKTGIADPRKDNWVEILPHRPDVKIEGIDLFSNHLVVHERARGLEQIRITDLSDSDTHYVEFPEPVYTFWFARNPEFETELVRFTYMSLVTPRSVYDYNMDTKERELLKEYEVLGGYDKSAYQSERIFATADDGTEIPISLVFKKGLNMDGTNPLYLSGYGAYGSSSDPYFSSHRISLLNRGFIYAIAHIRGGGEMGRQWYDDGKLLNKKNTFTDFISCAEHLITNGYTDHDHLIIEGGSAGGLLIGAVLNMRPDLAGIALAYVPFVDVLNTMMDPSIPLTVLEYEEWGNPNEKEYYDYIKSYSPYDNIREVEYPIMLVRAGLNDPRVAYWEPAKWVSRIRATKTDNNVIVMKTDMGAGHGGASGRYDYIRDLAFDYAFIFDAFGIKE